MKKKLYMLCLLLLFGGGRVAGQLKVDSLKNALRTAREDTNRAIIYHQLASELWRVRLEEGKEYAQKALELSKKLKYARGEGYSYNYLGLCTRTRDVKNSQIYFQRALDISTHLRDKKLLAFSNNNMGIAKFDQGQYALALQYLFKALRYNEELHDLQGQAMQLNNIGLVYKGLKKFDNALEAYRKASDFNQKTEAWVFLAGNYNNIGTTYREARRWDSALVYFQKAYQLNKRVNNVASQGTNLANIGDIYLEMNRPADAKPYLLQSRDINKKSQNKLVAQRNFALLARIYAIEGRQDSALYCIAEALTIVKTLKNRPQEVLSYREIARAYQSLGDFQQAAHFWERHTYAKDTLLNEEATKLVAEMQTIYETDKKEKEKELLVKENLLAKTRSQQLFFMIIAVSVALLSAVIVAVVLLRNNREKQRTNSLLARQARELHEANTRIITQNEELQQRQEEIIAQNDLITDQNKQLNFQHHQTQSSIQTALLIQRALLPFDDKLRALACDYFVLYRPRDIVSGDFYWAEKIDDTVILVAADCTGHGVPGAFMSLIAINLLERIILQQNITEPAQILQELHVLVRAVLKQEQTDDQTGMDICVACCAPAGKVLFAGAKRPLYYIDAHHPQEIRTLAGTRKSVGGVQNDRLPFKSEPIDLPTGSMLYLSSDGFADQNNAKRHRLGKERIFEVLLPTFALPAHAQKQALDALLEEQMLGTDQRDDILFLGVRL